MFGFKRKKTKKKLNERLDKQGENNNTFQLANLELEIQNHTTFDGQIVFQLSCKSSISERALMVLDKEDMPDLTPEEIQDLLQDLKKALEMSIDKAKLKKAYFDIYQKLGLVG